MWLTNSTLYHGRLIEVEYAEIEDRKVRNQLQNVGAIERQVGKADAAVSFVSQHLMHLQAVIVAFALRMAHLACSCSGSHAWSGDGRLP